MKIDWHNTINFIKQDWHEHPVRLLLETLAWAMNLTVALIFAATVPNIPLLAVYPIFLTALVIGMWSAVSRGSFGNLMTSITIFVIDSYAYIKLLYS